MGEELLEGQASAHGEKGKQPQSHPSIPDVAALDQIRSRARDQIQALSSPRAAMAIRTVTAGIAGKQRELVDDCRKKETDLKSFENLGER